MYSFTNTVSPNHIMEVDKERGEYHELRIQEYCIGN